MPRSDSRPAVFGDLLELHASPRHGTARHAARAAPYPRDRGALAGSAVLQGRDRRIRDIEDPAKDPVKQASRVRWLGGGERVASRA